MKKLALFLIVFIGLIFMSSCGKGGQNGFAYIAFDWDWYVDAYEDNNSATPSNFYNFTDYETTQGSYTYTYWCSDYYDFWYWEGTYTITINEGESGGFMTDGNDGEDNYFQFDLWGSGPDFYMNKPIEGKEKAPKLTLPSDEIKSHKGTPVGDMIIETIEKPGATMVITRQKFIVK